MPDTTAPTGIEAAVCADIARRQALGIAKYGQTVAENPLSLREWLQHAYEETLDQAVYLKRAMAEIDGDTPKHPDDQVQRLVSIYNDTYCHNRRAGVSGGPAELAAMRAVVMRVRVG